MKISHYLKMPKIKKMSGDGIFEDVKNVGKKLGKEAVDVAIPILKEEAKKMIKDAIKKKMGEGLYAANVGRGFRMKMSPAQVRSIKKGGAIQLNRDMLDEAGRFAMELKPEAMALLEKALKSSKGMRVTREHMMDLTDMKKGGSLLTQIGKIVAPMVAEKLMEIGIAKAGMGTPIEDQQFSISDVVRTGKRIFGGRMKKSGMGTPIEDQQFSISDVVQTGKRMFGGKFTKKQLTQIILDKNKVIADLEETAYGKGLFAGGGMSETSYIQTGSPYKNTSVQALNPYKETSNPYT
jgi:hypothetical protein